MLMPPFLQVFVTRAVGTGKSSIAKTFQDEWFGRGVIKAAAVLRPAPGDKAASGCSALYGAGYAAGAHAALRLATGVLSDAAIRGREIEALRLIADGADHAAVLAHLRASARQEHSAQGNVVTLSRTHTAPIASKGERL